MDNITGTPVRGDNLKFRDKDIEEIIDRLTTGSVMLIGLRRIGKTSVMLGVKDRMPDTWTITYHDLEGVQNPAAFFSILIRSLPPGNKKKLPNFWENTRAIPDRVMDYLRKNFDNILGSKISSKDIIDYWEPLTQGIGHVIKESPKPILIIMDEFPYFLENFLKSNYEPIVIEKMLAKLREWRNIYSNFHLLIGGSISLDHFLSNNNISAATITDFSRYFLPTLKKEQAELLLKELAESKNLIWYDESMISESLDLIEDYYPFFMQNLFMLVKSHGGPGGETLSDIYDNYFIPTIEKNFFNTFVDRLEKHYSKSREQMARVILNFISNQEGFIANYSQIRDAVSNLTAAKKIELDKILNKLVSDDFLTYKSRTNEYTFAVKLLGKWWKITWGRK